MPDLPNPAPEGTPEVPVPEPGQHSDQIQELKDEAIARRHELKPFKDAFSGYTEEEREAVLGMVGQLRDDPAAGVTRMRDIAYNMGEAIPEYDFLADAPWNANQNPPGTGGNDPANEALPRLTEEQITEIVRKEQSQLMQAAQREEVSRRIDTKATELGYAKYLEDGQTVTPAWDILITVAARPEFANMNSPEETIAAAHQWLEENGPRGQVPGTTHPVTAGQTPSGAPAPADAQADTPMTMEEAHRRARARAEGQL